jgi:hypothetical protein
MKFHKNKKIDTFIKTVLVLIIYNIFLHHLIKPLYYAFSEIQPKDQEYFSVILRVTMNLVIVFIGVFIVTPIHGPTWKFSEKELYELIDEVFPQGVYNERNVQISGKIESLEIFKLNFLQNMHKVIIFDSENYVASKHSYPYFETSHMIIKETGFDYEKTVFYGRWYIFKNSENVTEQITIISKDLIKDTDMNKDDIIRVEDINFNNSFQLTSKNHIETLKTLTPDMIRNILSVKEKTGNIILVFKGNEVHLGIDTSKSIYSIVKEKSIDRKNELSHLLEFNLRGHIYYYPKDKARAKLLKEKEMAIKLFESLGIQQQE